MVFRLRFQCCHRGFCLFVCLFVWRCLSGRWCSDSGFCAVIGAFVCLFVCLFVWCCLSGRWRSDSGFCAVIRASVCLFVCLVLFEW